MKFKVGDKVRIRKDLESGNKYGVNYVNDEMLQYKGKQAIIKKVLKVCEEYIIDIDNKGYYWTDEMLEPVKKNKVSTNSVESIDQFNLKSLEFGDIVTLRDKKVVIVTRNRDNCITLRDEYDYKYNDYNENLTSNFSKYYDIMKVERPVKLTKAENENQKIELIKVYEKKGEILDKKEKEYLAGIIRPFRDRIREISKKDYDNEEWIHFVLKKGNNRIEAFSLPNFTKNTMYKNMEIGKKYTLKELGL